MTTNKQRSGFDAPRHAQEISIWIRDTLSQVLKRQGAVVGISGGIDSAVVATLCVNALGAKRVIGIALPERESSPESMMLAQELAERLDIRFLVEDISAGLDGMGAYRRRDEAVRRVFPEYHEGMAFKITLQSNPLEGKMLNIFRLTVIDDAGRETSQRLGMEDYLQIVAASNMKQRLRMTMLYHHAELRNYAVIGTGNKNEHDLGFFVKYGDGGSDLMPIGHLFKTQIYQLAEVLGVPQEIVKRKPTTDTYPADVSQEEFFFRLPFDTMDAIWGAMEEGISEEATALQLDLDKQQVQRVMEDLRQKRRTTEFLRLPPLQIQPTTFTAHAGR